ncbi:DUF4142 domain-containing protein [Spirosoma taeanense]|uniref:DUF4142 domain-containing protein n=1 Tax=Spirosoma taeanense TaxID=2735870 RepID=A0A6M5YB51_9BACT|nr:DUF4142 domain-containing protein [Spirosoma taeanense]QJW91388.1 DUF4142 domain-containing protein [Spirosoma taeanense]
MKSNRVTALLLVGLILNYGCSSRNDSTEKAEKINAERIDKQAVAISSDAKDEAKGVTKNMVELANSSQTEYELSKLAVQKASNPQVKILARQIMTDHQQGDRELQNLAKLMNVVLPVGLSNDSKNQVGRLSDMRTSTEFDLQYLDYMTSVNDDALDIADDLRDDAPTDAVKTYAKKVLNNDKKHKEQAKQLRKALD